VADRVARVVFAELLEVGAGAALRCALDTDLGKAVAQFSVASHEYVGGKEKPEFHNVVTWDRLAETCGRYLGKGQQVAVEGRIQTRTWDDDQGKHHWKTEIVASSVEMLSGGRRKDYRAETSAQALEAQAAAEASRPTRRALVASTGPPPASAWIRAARRRRGRDEPRGGLRGRLILNAPPRRRRGSSCKPSRPVSASGVAAYNARLGGSPVSADTSPAASPWRSSAATSASTRHAPLRAIVAASWPAAGALPTRPR
jgi:single-strand DNA-binding protein